MEATFICSQCGKTKAKDATSCGTGYGTNAKGDKICYQCIGENDTRDFEGAQVGQKFTMYLTKNSVTGENEVTNWPGSFRAQVQRLHTGKHNIAGKRYDAYFKVRGNQFHGVTYGDNTQICHVKRIKG